jgi:hypothetical protein
MIVPRGRDLRTAEWSVSINERDRNIRLDQASVFESRVWRLGESVEKISTFILNQYDGLSSCDLLTDSGSGVEEFLFRDIRGEKEAEPFSLSTGKCFVELTVVQAVSCDNGSPTLHLGA